MKQLRIYKDEVLSDKSPQQLQEILDQVKTSIELSSEEKNINIEKIEYRLYNRKDINIQIAKDIKEGSADMPSMD